jgi:hypothetical protein
VKIESALFTAGAAFYLILTAIYGYFARDIVGIILLLFTGGLALIAGFYLLYTSKAVYPRPEDRMGAEVDEADPEYGFFSPHSWWPLAVGFSAFVLALGFIFAAWMFFFGVIILMIAVSGWLFEYYVGDHAH